MFLYSIEYLLALPLLLFVYYKCSATYRVYFLAAISLILIGTYNVSSVFFVLFFSWFNYSVGSCMDSSKGKWNSGRLFYGGIVINVLAILLINKLISSESLVGLQNSFTTGHRTTDVVLALGLSFYGLQNIAYLVDIQKKRIAPSIDFFRFLLFNSFFPKVSLGPIMRYQEFVDQLKTSREAKLIVDNGIRGCNRILLGLFKKLVLADRLSAITNSFFDNEIIVSGANAWVAVCLFLLQLYFDFSGYMDLAIGSAHLFGFKLKENFNFPLRSVSISDFWRKWHISLIDWLTIYVYYPLNFRLRHYKRKATALAIVVTFFLSGLWHGWGLTFICYALLHATYILLEMWFKNNPGAAIKFSGARWNLTLNYVVVFLLVALSLVFFRSPSMGKAVQIFQYLFNFNHFINPNISWRTWLINGGANIEVTFNNRLSIILSLLFILYERTITSTANASRFNLKYLFIFIAAIVVFGAFGSTQRFIYLQF